MRTRLSLLLPPLLSLAFAIGCAAPLEREEASATESDLTASASARTRDEVVDEARRQRLVGEQATGYLGLVDDPTVAVEGARAADDLSARVDHINIQRRALYSEIAVRNGVTRQTVAETTACVLFRDRVALDEAYRSEDARWLRHTATASVEMPSFCVDLVAGD